MSGGDEGPGFLGRWSARKRDADGAARRQRRSGTADVDTVGSEAVDADAADAAPDAALDAASEVAPDAATGVVLGTAPTADVVGASGTVPVPIDGRVHRDSAAARLDPGIATDPVAEAGGGGNAEPIVEPAPDDPAEPPLTDADMPPIASLDAGSDLSGFFSKGVSAALRRAALRHVFRQPAYNVRDGLNDYDGDYTVFEPLGDTVTSDMKFHAARRERERLERERLEAERREGERLARVEDGDGPSMGDEATDVTDVTDVPEAAEASDATDVTDVTDVTDAPEASDAADGRTVDPANERPRDLPHDPNDEEPAARG